jgi:hypothetical protein
MFFQIVDRFRLDEGHLILGRIRSGLDRVGSGSSSDGSGSNPNRSDGFLGSGRILPPLTSTSSFYPFTLFL